jgi:hypothetical protein
MFPVRVFLQVFILVLTAQVLAFAQDPVPIGEQGNLTLNGRVSDMLNKAIAGARITAVNSDIRITREAFTNADGVYNITRLPAGRYAVTAAIDGFTTERKEVTVSPQPNASNTTKVDFKLGGPVPIAEPNAGTKVEVVRNTFDNDLALQTWLNSQSAKGLRLTGIIPTQDKTSIFVFARVAPENNTAIVVTVNGSLEPAALSTRLAQYRSYVGVHRLSATSYLLVVR